MHPLGFTAKVQYHCVDNPTYSDIRRCTERDSKLWDVVMVKKLKSLIDLGSLKMIPHPKGS